MFTRSFVEKVLLMIIGSCLTYFIAIQIMKESLISDDEISNYNGPLNLNIHEKIIHNYVVTPDQINVSMNDIKGLTNAKSLLQKIVINPLKKNKSIHPPNGIILYGPPGTGKTMLAKALCKTMNVNFIAFEQSFIEQKMFGESAKMLKALFTLAEKIKPCVVFIDELDGIFSERSIIDQSFVTGLKTQMLTHLDGFVEKDPSILFIGATNRLSAIDSALKRRMRAHIEVSLPNLEDRRDIFKGYLNNIEVDYDKLATYTDGFSGSDIYEACKIASYTSENEKLCTSDILYAIDNCLSF